jgi:hypothetical protein
VGQKTRLTYTQDIRRDGSWEDDKDIPGEWKTRRRIKKIYISIGGTADEKSKVKHDAKTSDTH